MSTKKSAAGITHKSLVHVLEDCILAMEAQGQTEQDIFSMVNMIMRGFIRNGELTAEYVALAQQAREFQEQSAQHRTVLTDADGRPLIK
jgi:hypothetical protein